jgi:hypothetical protein
MRKVRAGRKKFSLDAATRTMPSFPASPHRHGKRRNHFDDTTKNQEKVHLHEKIYFQRDVT